MLLGYGVQNMNKPSKHLKNALISQPVLYIYYPSKPCHLFTDASSLGVAGVLKQPDEQGILHPIGYFSRKIHPYEQNYTASEIETLAIINSVQRFHTYLYKIHFILHTDHLPLKWIKNVKNPQDTLGGLHNYGTTRHSIHMIVDHHSKFLWAFPTKSVSTESYITCLRNLFQINKPEILITDRNAAFLSNKFKHFLDRNNVKHLLTSCHHPKTNAKVERLNAIIINRLRCEYNANLKIPWTKYIPKITESYNKTVHTTTGFTLKFFYYGIQPQTIKSHEHSKQLYDIKHPEPIFKEGDQVLVKTFIYPNTVTYEINKPNLPQRKQTEIIYSNKLKLSYPEADFLLHYSTNIENDLIGRQTEDRREDLEAMGAVIYIFRDCLQDFTAVRYLQDDDVPIDDTTTKPLFTPQEKGRKHTRVKVPRLRWNSWQKH
ncbi:K02A2.6-like, partial [Cordylochernes scorpioides]